MGSTARKRLKQWLKIQVYFSCKNCLRCAHWANTTPHRLGPRLLPCCHSAWLSMMAHHCIPIRIRKREGRTYSFLLKTSPSTLSIIFRLHALEKETATHSSVLACRVPGTAEPGGLPSMGSHRVGDDWSDLAVAVAVAISSTFNYFKEKLGKSILSQLSYTSGIKGLCLTHCIPNNTYLTWAS